MDKVAARLSFFMLCAVCVQIEYYNMEIINTVDMFVTRFGAGETQYYHIETVDAASKDLKSPGGNTLWVRLPPALLDTCDGEFAGILIFICE
ncbi:MAG: hypothetical protein JSW42_12325 [Chloroflexota bacterium]|nr:MAG: hypothetical protein JSW42_12325 [Chloroflexota bacterium]